MFVYNVKQNHIHYIQEGYMPFNAVNDYITYIIFKGFGKSTNTYSREVLLQATKQRYNAVKTDIQLCSNETRRCPTHNTGQIIYRQTLVNNHLEQQELQ